MESYLSIPEAADKLGISRTRVWKLVQEERFPGAFRIGRAWAVTQAWLRAARVHRPPGRKVTTGAGLQRKDRRKGR